MLNVALFGKTAKQSHEENADKKGKIRDYATLNQLLVLANMESYNVILIEQGKSQPERLIALRDLAVRQMQAMDFLNITRLPQRVFADYNDYEIVGAYIRGCWKIW